MKYVQDSWAYKKLSLFLLIKLGIEFGDDKVRNWLKKCHLKKIYWKLFLII